MATEDSSLQESMVAATRPQSAGLHDWPVYQAINGAVRSTIDRLGEASA